MEKRIDPWGLDEVEDYRNLFDEFGIESFERFREKLSDNRYIRRGIVFGHRDFGRIMQSIEEKKRFAMMTGLMPSGRFHFGHKMVAEQIIYYQKLGAEIFLCSADLEAYLMRGISPQDSRRIALEEYLTNYVALGLTDEVNFWYQTDYVLPYYQLRDMLSAKVTFNELKGIYGELSTGKILSVLTQAADILHPQLLSFGGPRATVVPVGADQDPHLRLTRDLASRFQAEFKFVLPSSTYHKFMRGLQGGKMSSSDPRSYIALTDEPMEAKEKVMRAKTGGRATAEEQKKMGGVPEDCMVYDLLLYHLIDDDSELEKVYGDCRSGSLICGECKKKCAELVVDFLREHQKKREKAKAVVERILEKKVTQ
ncbi:MAG: tryptophan--tRNA ligase [Candidatus Altiarchaeota archaeon]|nr:tryptophan--tRNA ligase [Candidatus Altiarchaeota archaeon]